MVTRVMGTLVLVWCGSEAMRDDEWSSMIAIHRAQPDLNKLRIFVVTEGATPSPSQQKQLFDLLGGRTVSAAVLSDGIGPRFVISALALFIKRIRGFRIDELGAAAAHLAMTPEEQRAAEAFLIEMGVTKR